jgi:hypothetical protein
MTKQHTFEAVPITNCKIVERGKMGSPNTHIHDRALAWFGTCTSIKHDRVKLVLWTQTSPLSEIATVW